MIEDYRIAGTRITVWDVLHHLENGWGVAETADVFSVSVSQVQTAAEFIQAHRAEVMKVHQQIEARNAAGNRPEIRSALEAARQRRLAWQEQQHVTSHKT